MIIAITGCIGSGKSYYAHKINELYLYDVFSADTFAKLAYNDKNIQFKLDNVFKCLVDGKIDINIIKKQLNEENIKKLNNIIHPFVIDKIKEVKNQYLNSIAFIEVPLLFESKLENLFDYTIAISVDDDLRRKRLLNRDLKNYQNMIKLEKYQFNNATKAKMADFVLYSSDDDTNNLALLNDIINKISKEVI